MSEVSDILGQYMLKGWVLTDKTCTTPGCSVPLMRTSNGRSPLIHFCAKCDGGPDSARHPTAQVPGSSVSVSSSSHCSRSSTPPTEVSSTLSSPAFVLPAETEEGRQRREQSDTASAAIGQRLLKGWAMLADECPSARCFGVPLVRPPKAGGDQNPRKECVICGTVYVTEIDWAGRERLVPENFSTAIVAPIRENKGEVQALKFEATPTHDVRLETGFAAPQVKLIDLSVFASLNEQNKVTQVPVSTICTSERTSTLLSTLDQSAQDLESTLRVLSGRLTALTAGQLDASSIGSVADAISKVVQAIGQVRQLQWAEKHAGENL
ncbi:hypothetical protein GGX14DRAFT_614754 [Mycena pura]|uniref:Sjogren's syndrome/scleroderma autoantigen 1 (Autoantigen p27) protein n=1 Tax=Mycena pura TaxID=153505 RepID=A0AAD6YTW4_9AGAR|nr:hypothetical protein GGX14DRAFT_614754 [Mycena pura]